MFFVFFFFLHGMSYFYTLDDVAIGVYTSPKTFHDRIPALLDTWLKEIPNLFLFSYEIPEKSKEILEKSTNINLTFCILNNSIAERKEKWESAQNHHFHYMNKLFSLNKDKKWIILCDDDTFLYKDQLLNVLNEYDYRDYHIIGRSFLVQGDDEYITEDVDYFQMIHGGSGLVMSNAYAKAVIPHILGCSKDYEMVESDKGIVFCAQHFIENSQNYLFWQEGFNALPPLGERPIKRPPISYHKVIGDSAKTIWRATNSEWEDRKGRKWRSNWSNLTLTESFVAPKNERNKVGFMFGYKIYNENRNEQGLFNIESPKPIFERNKIVAYSQEFENKTKIIYRCDNNMEEGEILPVYDNKYKNELLEFFVKCPTPELYHDYVSNITYLFE